MAVVLDDFELLFASLSATPDPLASNAFSNVNALENHTNTGPPTQVMNAVPSTEEFTFTVPSDSTSQERRNALKRQGKQKAVEPTLFTPETPVWAADDVHEDVCAQLSPVDAEELQAIWEAQGWSVADFVDAPRYEDEQETFGDAATGSVAHFVENAAAGPSSGAGWGRTSDAMTYQAQAGLVDEVEAAPGYADQQQPYGDEGVRSAPQVFENGVAGSSSGGETEWAVEQSYLSGYVSMPVPQVYSCSQPEYAAAPQLDAANLTSLPAPLGGSRDALTYNAQARYLPVTQPHNDRNMTQGFFKYPSAAEQRKYIEARIAAPSSLTYAPWPDFGFPYVPAPYAPCFTHQGVAPAGVLESHTPPHTAPRSVAPPRHRASRSSRVLGNARRANAPNSMAPPELPGPGDTVRYDAKHVKAGVYSLPTFQCSWEDCATTLRFEDYTSDDDGSQDLKYQRAVSAHIDGHEKESVADSSDGKYVCRWAHCRARLADRKGLGRHIRARSGHAPFGFYCLECEPAKRFSRNDLLPFHRDLCHSATAPQRATDENGQVVPNANSERREGGTKRRQTAQGSRTAKRRKTTQ